MRRTGMLLLALVLPSEALFGQATTQSPHERLPDGLTCSSCHTTAGWSPLRADLEFDHGDDVGFELEGQHTELSCISCHAAARFDEVVSLAGDCASCHLDVHQAAFDRDCVACHTTESFRLIESWAVHPADYPLEGAHLQDTMPPGLPVRRGPPRAPSPDEGGGRRPGKRRCRSRRDVLGGGGLASSPLGALFRRVSLFCRRLPRLWCHSHKWVRLSGDRARGPGRVSRAS